MSPRVSTRLLARQSDARLLELLGQGHERAFEALVLRYRGELLSYCHRLGLADGRAEDALQHALLKAWLALQGGTEVRELRAWLYRIVHNTAVNVMRSSPEERALDLDAALIDAATVSESELERATAAREALAHVAALPPMQRHAMLLSAVEGRSHEEVASALGITDVAVRGLLYRARVTLRAAAAAFTPTPLIGWFSQASSRLATTAGGLAGVSAGGAGSDLGGVLVKGAAVAATAALAAGAVLGPLRGHHAKSRPAPARHALASTEAKSATAGREGISTSAGPGAHLQLVSGKSSTGLGHTLLRRVSAGVHAQRVPLLNPTSSRALPAEHASAPSSAVATQPTGTGPARGEGGSGSGGGEVGTVAEVGGGSKGGDGSESDPTRPESGGGSEGEHKTGGPGEHESDGAQEKSENEAEASREKSEREAEAARESSEREAEARRELEDKASH
jgi:RNA polymerase sigma factor (sigma-70 family)